MRFLGIVTFIVCLLFAPLAFSASFYLSPEGNDETGEADNPEKPFLTFQYVLDQTNPGDRVEVGSGTYALTPVLVPWYVIPLPDKLAPIQLVGKSDLTIVGHEDSLIEAPGAGDVLVLMNCTNIVIKNINFEGNRPPVPTVTYQGGSVPLLFSTIHLRGENREITISECTFSKYGNHAISHLWSPKSSEHVTVNQCSFYSGGATGVTNLERDGSAVSGIGSYWNVSSNYVQDCVRGLEIECFSPRVKHDITLSNNYLTNTLDLAIMLFATCRTNDVPPNFKDVTIEHNTIERAKLGIFVTGGDRIKVTGNTVKNITTLGIEASASFNNLSNVEVSSNSVYQAGWRGIQMMGGNYELSGATLISNTLETTANSGILLSGDDILVQNNSCKECGWEGLYGERKFAGIELSGKNIKLIENHLFNESNKFMAYGVMILPSSVNTTLWRNRIGNPILGAVQDQGKDTVCQVLSLPELTDESGKFLLKGFGVSGARQVLSVSEDAQNWVEALEQEADEYGDTLFEYQPSSLKKKLFFRVKQTLK